MDRQPDSIPLWVDLKALDLIPGFMWLSMAPAASQTSNRGCLSLKGNAVGREQCACDAPVWLPSPLYQLPVSNRLCTHRDQVSFITLFRSHVLVLSLPRNLLMISPPLHYLLKSFHSTKGSIMKPDEEWLPKSTSWESAFCMYSKYRLVFVAALRIESGLYLLISY